ncbi:MAG TPA: hypothetical protein VME45_07325 [Stellaceae bacterium]|nr:hypothetical protein [Stellaceae bacterium]
MRRPTRLDLVLAIALGAAALVALLAVHRTAAAAQAWLAAYLFWAGLPIGALFLVLTHGLTGGEWGLTLRPGLFAMLRAMPLLPLLLIPVLFGARHIYPWAMAHEHGWLALPLFVARAIVYVVLWNAIAVGAMRWMQPDGCLPPGVAWPALIVLFASTTLAAFDWLMSLEPHWTSTIYGLMVIAGWTISALAAALALAAGFAAPRIEEALDAPARILLALVYLWAYLSVVQLIVIWESDLAHEIPWYLRRSTDGWQWVAVAIAVGEFVVPFLTLIWRPLRRSRQAVLAVALVVLAGHTAEIWWLAMPDFTRGFGWADVLAFIAIGAAFLYVGGRDFDFSLPLETRPHGAGK